NISVVSGLVPPTGLPLPFISAGSTSIMIFMSMVGIVQNVHRQSLNRV
ncbi:MAG: FtsW/RodA/SpoVE family cell cycle protein, partial [Clostridia bacterium]|nr:FtsW/RodA/SpoVE family cell cycle protein [Clostridia bacterium]